MRSLRFASEWLDLDGRVVTLDGIKRRIEVRTHRQSYPYDDVVVSVYARPIDRHSQQYLATKQELGDDWDTDVLASAPEVEATVLCQALEL